MRVVEQAWCHVTHTSNSADNALEIPVIGEIFGSGEAGGLIF